MILYIGSEHFFKMATIFKAESRKRSITEKVLGLETWFLCQTICFRGQENQISHYFYKLHATILV